MKKEEHKCVSELLSLSLGRLTQPKLKINHVLSMSSLNTSLTHCISCSPLLQYLY